MFFFILTVVPQIHPFDFGEQASNSGDIIIAICVVTKGDFPMKIYWTLNDKPINDFEGITVMSTNKRASQLTIEAVQAYHTGFYNCIAENKAGIANFSTVLNVNGTFFNIFDMRMLCSLLLYPFLNQFHIKFNHLDFEEYTAT